VSRE
jgi:hypothetical protein